jgi:hypothetical protein
MIDGPAGPGFFWRKGGRGDVPRSWAIRASPDLFGDLALPRIQILPSRACQVDRFSSGALKHGL